MIVKMKKSANLAVIETVAMAFEKAGYDVQIKNHAQPTDDAGIILAVLGLGMRQINFLFLERLTGIEKIESCDDFFTANHDKFVEAQQFFAGT